MPIYVLSLVLWGTCWWFFFRMVGRTIRQELHGAIIGLVVAGCVIPPLGMIMAVWYWIAGPTKRRVEAKIQNVIRSVPDSAIADSIDQQIASTQEAYPWVEGTWRRLDQWGKIHLIGQIRVQFNEIACADGELSSDGSFVGFDLIGTAALAVEIQRQQALAGYGQPQWHAQ